MPTLADKEIQARLLREIVDVNEKKHKLEDYIRTVDSLNNSLLESAAQRDIEAFRSHPPVPEWSR